MIEPRLIRQLEALDWDFPIGLQGSSKSIHWYPGTFPAELPSTLIQALSKPGNVIFDPYGGVGTTALEALRQQRRALLIECNPVAVLISYVSGGLILLKAIDKALPFILIDMVRRIVDCNNPKEGESGRLATDSHLAAVIDGYLSKMVSPKPRMFAKDYQTEPIWSELSCWIEKNTLCDIKQLFCALNEAPLGQFGRLVGLVMISAILKSISSQTKSWGHIADNVRPKEFERKNVFLQCNKWLSRTKSILTKTDVAELDIAEISTPRYWIAKHDWNRRSRPKTSFKQAASLIITSPPYGGAIDYTFAQRLSLYLLGFSNELIGQLSNAEIGARRRRFTALSRDSWADNLKTSMDKQVLYLDEKSYIALVLPHKDTNRGIGATLIEKLLLGKAWQKAFEVDRSIRQRKARQSWTSIMKETIQIYEH